MIYHLKKKKRIIKKGNQISLKQRIKTILHEINGFSPYEKNIISFLKLGKEKKAMKYGKRHLGSIKRAKTKIENLNNLTRILH